MLTKEPIYLALPLLSSLWFQLIACMAACPFHPNISTPLSSPTSIQSVALTKPSRMLNLINQLFDSLSLSALVLPSRSYPMRLSIHRHATVQSPATTTATTISTTQTSESNIDANVIMILAVLLCALICALGINSLVRCMLFCWRGTVPEPSSDIEKCNDGGVEKKILKSMPTHTYKKGTILPRSESECAICLSDFENGEKLRVLPKCNHGFHAGCIDRWLATHSSCPTCRRCLTSSFRTPVVIRPLDPEDTFYDYMGVY